MGENIEDILKIGFFVLVAVVQLAVRLKKDKSNKSEAKAPADTHLAQWLLRAKDMVDDALARATTLNREVGLLVEKRLNGVDADRLSKVAYGLHSDLKSTLAAFEQARKLTESDRSKAELAALANGDVLRNAFARLEAFPEEIAALAATFEMHERTADRAELDRWRAFARDAVEPLWRFASTRGLKVPSLQPLLVPVSTPRHAVRSLFIGTPLIFVDPTDHGPEQAFEITRDLARTLFAQLPDLQTWASAEAPVVHPRLPTATARGVSLDVEDLVRAWLPDVILDALVAAILGPAAMNAMVATLARPQAPESVVLAGSSGGRLSHGTPADFRVRMMARMLGRLDHAEDLAAGLRHWDQIHDHPQALLIPMADGRRARVAVGPFVDAAHGVVEQFYSDHCKVVAGYPLAAIQDFVLSPSTVSRMGPQIDALAQGHSAALSPRLMVVGGIQAIASHPAHRSRILDALRRDSASVVDGKASLSDADDVPTVRRAMLLRMVLAKPGGRATEQARL